MNEEVAAVLKGITFYQFICWSAFVIVVVVGVKKLIAFVYDCIDQFHQRKVEYESYKETLNHHVMAIQSLQDADTNIYACLEEINSNVNLINSSIDDMIEKDKTSKLNELRRTLLGYYEKYYVNNPDKTIDNMHLKNFHDCLDIYCQQYHGNSYVLDVVVPAMKTLNVVQVWNEEVPKE